MEKRTLAGFAERPGAAVHALERATLGMTGPKVQVTQLKHRARSDEILKGIFEDARHRPREKLLYRQRVKGSK